MCFYVSLLVGARTLLVVPGHTTRNKKLLKHVSWTSFEAAEAEDFRALDYLLRRAEQNTHLCGLQASEDTELLITSRSDRTLRTGLLLKV